jgi:23S rRNA (guanosine2251-2'-O)-methyltransferase
MAGEIIHGANAVGEALRSGRRINRIYFAKESRVPQARALVDEAKVRRVPFEFVPQAKLNELAGTREHQGVAASLSPVDYATLGDCLARCPARATLLLLDQVQHTKNLGMMIRSAVGAGACGIVLPAKGGALLDDSVVRASAGTVFHLPVVVENNLPQAIRVLQEAGFWVYGLDAKGEQSVFDIDWPDKCALVVGNETDGIRPGVAKACDVLVRIPLQGGLDSLNVAIAASIALFQVSARKSK